MGALGTIVRSSARVLLGLFVLGQAFFLVASFFIRIEETLRERVGSFNDLEERYPTVFRGEDPVHKSLTTFQTTGLKRYGQATAQPQNWALFAPNVAEAFSFAALEVRWDADRMDLDWVTTHPHEPLYLPAVNEPEDINAFLRYKNFRLRRYEMQVTPTPARREMTFDPLSERWRKRIEESTNEDGENIAAYLRWRWREYHRSHPDLPQPTQVILHMRGYGIPPPPGPSPFRFVEFGQHRVARWLPWKDKQTGTHALQRYNPQTDRYESVP